MPTNFLRPSPKSRQSGKARSPVALDRRRIALTIGDARLLLVPNATRTAELIWHALPLFSIVETWGESIHFEIPVRAPRDRTARLNGRPKDAYYWADDERVVLCYGPTPISAPNEIRLMRPCNVWAAIEGDTAVLKGTVPGTKVSLTRAGVAG